MACLDHTKEESFSVAVSNPRIWEEAAEDGGDLLIGECKACGSTIAIEVQS